MEKIKVMKNFLLSLSLLVLNIFQGIGQSSDFSVKPEEAIQVAVNIFSERFPNQNFNSEYPEVFIIERLDFPVFYAVNFEHGFVLVSAFKNVWPVLAYSCEGKFSKPCDEQNVKAWVKQYEDQILYACSTNRSATLEIQKAWDKYLSSDFAVKAKTRIKYVEPLLTSKWNQGIYYNAMCPADPGGPGGHTYAGCVATAMGQVMYYFRHPETGTGEYSYFHPDYDTIAANFENTTYKWNEMVNQLGGNNPAVAELLFHLGVSVDMDYGPDGSGMYNHKAAYSLRTYFKYSPQTQYVFRDSTTMDWDSLLVSHLDQKIPMYYAGWSEPDVVGHAFVVDGYQEGSYYHFNWGWSGSYDGYFYTQELTPGGSNFNLAQELIIHCTPDTINYTYPIYCEGDKEFTSHEGTFDDGSGPLYNYAPSSQCSFLLNPQNEFDSIISITLSFQRFKLESDDYLSIFDGEDTNAPLIGTFSGDQLPPEIISSGNKLFVLFLTNPRGSAEGFFASYHSQKPVWCTGMTTLTANEGAISDGSSSFYYNNGSVCLWYINPEGASKVTFSFSRFDTEPNNDKVKIYDPTTNQLLGEFSGYYPPDSLPPPVISPVGKMFITFTTNNSVRADGWEATYYTDLVGIKAEEINSELKIFPNPSKGIATITWKNQECMSETLEIFNSVGHLIKKIFLTIGQNQYLLNIPDLTSGFYVVKLTHKEGFIINKLMIE